MYQFLVRPANRRAETAEKDLKEMARSQYQYLKDEIARLRATSK